MSSRSRSACHTPSPKVEPGSAGTLWTGESRGAEGLHDRPPRRPPQALHTSRPARHPGVQLDLALAGCLPLAPEVRLLRGSWASVYPPGPLGTPSTCQQPAAAPPSVVQRLSLPLRIRRCKRLSAPGVLHAQASQRGCRGRRCPTGAACPGTGSGSPRRSVLARCLPQRPQAGPPPCTVMLAGRYYGPALFPLGPQLGKASPPPSAVTLAGGYWGPAFFPLGPPLGSIFCRLGRNSQNRSP